MCHPGSFSYFHALKTSCVQTRWSDRQQSVAVEGAGGGCLTKRFCICSPTKHPGSFRCRQHKAEYVWSGKSGNRSSGSQMDSLDF
uniref:Uncharacterized protein n=1 Tax=Kalanchoe fedtschenkoi TaxID=63787 RepID=A0A7N0T7V7_KALFE